MKILIIEDEYSLADAIAETLKKENFTPYIITNGEEGENEAVSKMIVKPVEETFEKQKQFISDASHELKTPLAI